MKRRHATAAFVAVSVAAAALTVSQWLTLRHSQAVNSALLAVPATLDADQFADTVSDSVQGQPLEVRFARASALLSGGELELAKQR